jgi:hypothetical protein
VRLDTPSSKQLLRQQGVTALLPADGSRVPAAAITITTTTTTPPAGLEVGRYAGCVAAWRAAAAAQSDRLPARVQRSIAGMEAALADYPLYEPQVPAAAHTRRQW